MSDTKVRLMQFFKNQGFRLNAVVKKISVSEKYFSSKSAVNSDVLEKIAIEFPELNINWVVSGRGEMLMPGIDTHPCIFYFIALLFHFGTFL